MRLKILVIFFSLIIFGCSSTYIIDQSDSENNISKINYLSKTYTCSVELNDGTEFTTKYLEIKNDSLYYHIDGSGALNINLVKTIKLRDIWQGFFDGLFLGLPISIATSVISINLLDEPLETILYTGISFISTIVINIIESHKKTFVFERNLDKSFSFYIQ